MAKRFTETEIWKSQRWFRKLSPIYKLAFCYIKDNCNHSGLWKVDCSDLIDDLGLESFDMNEFIEDVNTEFDPLNGKKVKKERLRLVKKNYLWITGFIQFQYEGKDKTVSFSAPVRTALMFLQSIDLLQESIDKGYVTLKEPLPEGWKAPKDKDKDKDKEYEKGVQGEKQGFKTMPKPEDVGELPDVKIQKAIEALKIQTDQTVDAQTVVEMWGVFKVQFLTGTNFYPDVGKVESHFLNWILKKKFERNGIGKTRQERTTSSLERLAQRGSQAIDRIRAKDG